MTRFFSAAQAAILVLLTGFASSEAVWPDGAIGAEHGPTEVASAYLAVMESGDLEAAEALFAGHSSIFESGGQEGDWQHYREHHIGPELAEIRTFSISQGEPEVQESQDGSMAFVAWPIEYRITLEDQRVVESIGTVTFVMVRGDKGFLIRHLHWSSRRKKAADG